MVWDWLFEGWGLRHEALQRYVCKSWEKRGEREEEKEGRGEEENRILWWGGHVVFLLVELLDAKERASEPGFQELESPKKELSETWNVLDSGIRTKALDSD